MNRALSLLAASACATVLVSATCLAEVAPTIDFAFERTSMPNRAQLRLNTRFGGKGNSNWSQSLPIAELRGLAPAQLHAASSTAVRFALVREAGRIDCAGETRRGTGLGSCAFVADPRFAALLASRGIARPNLKQSYALTMSAAGRAQLDALAAANYGRPTLDQLVALSIHKVTPGYIRGLADAGYRLGSIGDLVEFKIHNVSPELIRAYRELGYRQLSADDLMAMAIHRVTPESIRGFAKLGYRNLSADKLVELSIFNVTPDYIRGLQAEGITLPSADQLVRLRLAGFGPKRPGR